MRLHSLQHVPFEDTANIKLWAKERGHGLTTTHLYENEHLPDMRDFDWLVVMGGPMNIHEQDEYPWLAREKRFIRRAIDNDKIVLGICLGAQLIADVMGGSVFQGPNREIGWHQVNLTEEGTKSKLFKVLPESFTAFQWHGDTFNIPKDAICTAKSEAYQNQAFEIGRAIALQFHLESSIHSIEHLIDNCRNELDSDSPYVQSADTILDHTAQLVELRKLMNRFMDRIENQYG